MPFEPLETCAASYDATLKISSTYLLLSNRCIAIIESSYLDIHNSLSLMYPMDCNFIQIPIEVYYGAINYNMNLIF